VDAASRRYSGGIALGARQRGAEVTSLVSTTLRCAVLGSVSRSGPSSPVTGPSAEAMAIVFVLARRVVEMI
jgi:hypothetical protein